MHLRSLVVTFVSALPVMATSMPNLALTASKPLPAPMSSAIQRFSADAANGQLPRPRSTPAPPPRVCSIPLVEVSPQRGPRVADRMPRVPATSLDHNQIPPPAPPCTADNRFRPTPPRPRNFGPRPLR
jgi:hypothetical protein